MPEQRAPTRFRVPDVCVVKGEPAEQIFHTPPFICIEVLSKDDRLIEMLERVEITLRSEFRTSGFSIPTSGKLTITL